MEIRIDQLKERPRQLVLTEPITDFPILSTLVQQRAVVFSGGIDISLVASLVGEFVEVSGTLTCSLELPCSRCLQPVAQHLELPIVLSFTRQPAADLSMAAEYELSEDEVGLIIFEGESIDLRSPLEQELLMALPQHPLCRDDCAGLCPVCGADLNQHGCDCSPPQFHGGLAALRSFKVAKD